MFDYYFLYLDVEINLESEATGVEKANKYFPKEARVQQSEERNMKFMKQMLKEQNRVNEMKKNGKETERIF